MKKKLICDLHNEIILLLKESAEQLMKSKEALVNDKAVMFYALALKRISGAEGLIKQANKEALHMEECLRLRKTHMERAKIEDLYQVKKEVMKEHGFFTTNNN